MGINGFVIVSNNFTIGYGSIGSGTVLLSGPNAKFFATNSASSSGISASPMPSQLVISNGTCMIGGAAPYFFVGSASFGKGVLTMSGGALTIVGSTATLVANPASSIGEIWLLGNGNPVLNAKDITLSGGSGSSGKMVVSNGTVSMSGTLSVGSATGTGTVYVANGAVLEAPAYSVNSASQNTVSNMGGVFQYTNASPSITPGTFGNVGIQNGTISFRAITNADVLCNQGTKPLDSTTKMLWVTGGSNTFRLNNATNSGTINQSYTFAPGTATNFARLELVNGSTCRNGSVTIGAGGSLYVSSGASTLSSVLTAAPSSTIEFDLSNSNAPACLLSTTNMYLNNCTLQLDLANPPIINTQFMIISNTLASQLSYSFAGSSTKQTVTLNGTNYLTSISLAGGGTKVVVQTMILPYGTSVFFH